MPPTLLLVTWKHHHMPGNGLQGQFAILTCDKTTTIQAALTSIEMFDRTKSKFETIKNAVQISGQNIIHIAFSQSTGCSVLTANTLKSGSPNLTWTELKNKLSIQYSIIPSDAYETQAYTHLEQGLDELLDNYIHHASKLLSKIYHASDMSRISVEGTNHYAVIYSLNCRKPKDSMVGHQSVQWEMMDECFRDMHNISAWL